MQAQVSAYQHNLQRAPGGAGGFQQHMQRRDDRRPQEVCFDSCSLRCHVFLNSKCAKGFKLNEQLLKLQHVNGPGRIFKWVEFLCCFCFS